MGVIRKTFKKLGLIKPKFNSIHILHADYIAFKALSAHFIVTNYELFTKMLEYFAEGLRHDYHKENKELLKNLATLSNAVKQYERKFGKLYIPTTPEEEKGKK